MLVLTRVTFLQIGAKLSKYTQTKDGISNNLQLRVTDLVQGALLEVHYIVKQLLACLL